MPFGTLARQFEKWHVFGTLARKNEMLARFWHVNTPICKWHVFGKLARKNEMLARFWHVGTHGTRFSKLLGVLVCSIGFTFEKLNSKNSYRKICFYLEKYLEPT